MVDQFEEEKTAKLPASELIYDFHFIVQALKCLKKI